MLKKIDKLLIKSFLPPFVVTFFIALFVFIMSFLWTYVDEMIGKGADIFIFSELFFYLSISFFPSSLPIAVLIASVMVIGNLSERYELTSLKSAGIPLLRTMAPLMIVTFGISLFSYICSDRLIPVANLQFKTRLFDIRRNKPTLNMEQGVFNYDFKGFVMHIGEKGEDNRSIKDVIIYDHNSYNKNSSPRILAKEGEMYTTADQKFFVMALKDGTMYREVNQSSKDKKDGYPFMRMEFENWSKVFDLGEFDINESDRRAYKSHHAMLSRRQLIQSIDSLDITVFNKKAAIANTMTKQFKNLFKKYKVEYLKQRNEIEKDQKQKELAKAKNIREKEEEMERRKKIKNTAKKSKDNEKDKTKVKQAKSTFQKSTSASMAKDKLKKVEERPKSRITKKKPLKQVAGVNLDSCQSLLATFLTKDKAQLLSRAKSTSKNIGSQINASISSLHRLKESRVKHIFELHSKFTLALACFIFLFIGAPMGAIIRKGGFGFPILIAIFFFVLFTVLNIFCKKVAESLVINAVLSAWIPILIIFPIGAFLTYRAMQDRKVVDFDLMMQKISSLFKLGKKETETS